MSVYTEKASENVAVVGMVDPVSASSGAKCSEWFKVDKFHRYLAIVLLGAQTSGGTLTASIQQAYAAAGTGGVDVTALKITDITADGAGSKCYEINFRASDLYGTGTTPYTWFWARLRITAATQAILQSGVVLAIGAKDYPASDNDSTYVAEIV